MIDYPEQPYSQKKYRIVSIRAWHIKSARIRHFLGYSKLFVPDFEWIEYKSLLWGTLFIVKSPLEIADGLLKSMEEL